MQKNEINAEKNLESDRHCKIKQKVRSNCDWLKTFEKNLVFSLPPKALPKEMISNGSSRDIRIIKCEGIYLLTNLIEFTDVICKPLKCLSHNKDGFFYVVYDEAVLKFEKRQFSEQTFSAIQQALCMDEKRLKENKIDEKAEQKESKTIVDQLFSKNRAKTIGNSEVIAENYNTAQTNINVNCGDACDSIRIAEEETSENSRRATHMEIQKTMPTSETNESLKYEGRRKPLNVKLPTSVCSTSNKNDSLKNGEEVTIVCPEKRKSVSETEKMDPSDFSTNGIPSLSSVLPEPPNENFLEIPLQESPTTSQNYLLQPFINCGTRKNRYTKGSKDEHKLNDNPYKTRKHIPPHVTRRSRSYPVYGAIKRRKRKRGNEEFNQNFDFRFGTSGTSVESEDEQQPIKLLPHDTYGLYFQKNKMKRRDEINENADNSIRSVLSNTPVETEDEQNQEITQRIKRTEIIPDPFDPLYSLYDFPPPEHPKQKTDNVQSGHRNKREKAKRRNEVVKKKQNKRRRTTGIDTTSSRRDHNWDSNDSDNSYSERKRLQKQQRRTSDSHSNSLLSMLGSTEKESSENDQSGTEERTSSSDEVEETSEDEKDHSSTKRDKNIRRKEAILNWKDMVDEYITSPTASRAISINAKHLTVDVDEQCGATKEAIEEMTYKISRGETLDISNPIFVKKSGSEYVALNEQKRAYAYSTGHNSQIHVQLIHELAVEDFVTKEVLRNDAPSPETKNQISAVRHLIRQCNFPEKFLQHQTDWSLREIFSSILQKTHISLIKMCLLDNEMARIAQSISENSKLSVNTIKLINKSFKKNPKRCCMVLKKYSDEKEDNLKALRTKLSGLEEDSKVLYGSKGIIKSVWKSFVRKVGSDADLKSFVKSIEARKARPWKVPCLIEKWKQFKKKTTTKKIDRIEINTKPTVIISSLSLFELSMLYDLSDDVTIFSFSKKDGRVAVGNIHVMLDRSEWFQKDDEMINSLTVNVIYCKDGEQKQKSHYSKMYQQLHSQLPQKAYTIDEFSTLLLRYEHVNVELDIENISNFRGIFRILSNMKTTSSITKIGIENILA